MIRKCEILIIICVLPHEERDGPECSLCHCLNCLSRVYWQSCMVRFINAMSVDVWSGSAQYRPWQPVWFRLQPMMTLSSLWCESWVQLHVITDVFWCETWLGIRRHRMSIIITVIISMCWGGGEFFVVVFCFFKSVSTNQIHTENED